MSSNETNEATERAAMPKGTNSILDRRTVEHSNRNLLDVVKPGQRVLDVGCGSGAITKGIRDLVDHKGQVVGIDTSEHLIALAREQYTSVPNLRFEVADIHTYQPAEPFDVVTSARVLQWLSNPEAALRQMKTMLKVGGCLTILDYNHEKIQWAPAAPKSMQTFYAAFLKWRRDAGMNNAIADQLPAMFEKIGLENIATDQSELTTSDSLAFTEEAGIWAKVAEMRGKQMVEDHYVTEELRLQAIVDYKEWIATEAKSMKMYLRAVTGYQKSDTSL
jgi:ubiquinone/menaquinone biosynthesis C-methylase UbiE